MWKCTWKLMSEGQSRNKEILSCCKPHIISHIYNWPWHMLRKNINYWLQQYVLHKSFLFSRIFIIMAHNILVSLWNSIVVNVRNVFFGQFHIKFQNSNCCPGNVLFLSINNSRHTKFTWNPIFQGLKVPKP